MKYLRLEFILLDVILAYRPSQLPEPLSYDMPQVLLLLLFGYLIQESIMATLYTMIEGPYPRDDVQ